MRTNAPRAISTIPMMMRGRIGRLRFVRVKSRGLSTPVHPPDANPAPGDGERGRSRAPARRSTRTAHGRVGGPPQPPDALANLVDGRVAEAQAGLARRHIAGL